MIKDSALGLELARLHWRKSSYSGTAGNCVDVATRDDGSRAIRDSKNSAGPVLTCTLAEWSAFTADIRSAQFD